MSIECRAINPVSDLVQFDLGRERFFQQMTSSWFNRHSFVSCGSDSIEALKMSEIVKLTGNIFEASHIFENGRLQRRISVPGSPAIFKLIALREGEIGAWYVLVSITADDPKLEFEAAITATCYAIQKKEEDVVSHVKHASSALFQNMNLSLKDLVVIKVKFLNINPPNMDCNQFIIPVAGDLKSYIDRGSQVTLVGGDGSLTVPKRLLEIRSSALEMIFNHDSKEKQTGAIELKDYNSKTLDAFIHFLMEGKIKDGKETALGLILLGDKYDIQFMKKEAEKFVKEHFHELDQDEAMDIMCKVSRETVKVGLIRGWRPE